jgi:hypothetical protein
MTRQPRHHGRQRPRLVGPFGPQGAAAAAHHDEAHAAGPQDDMIEPRGADARAAQEVPAVGPQLVDDVLDGDLDAPEPGDDDKSAGDGHGPGIGRPFVAHRSRRHDDRPMF